MSSIPRRPITYNLNGALRKLKSKTRSMFMGGASARVAAELLQLSPALVREWHDEFVLEILEGSSGRRVFTREIILRNSPTALMVLVEQMKQKGDESLRNSASRSFLGFANRFLGEDARIIESEKKAKQITDADKGLSKTLFDFVDPDGATEEEESALDIADHEEEIMAAMALLEEDEHAEIGIPTPPAIVNTPAAVDLFDGLDSDLPD